MMNAVTNTLSTPSSLRSDAPGISAKHNPSSGHLRSSVMQVHRHNTVSFFCYAKTALLFAAFVTFALTSPEIIAVAAVAAAARSRTIVQPDPLPSEVGFHEDPVKPMENTDQAAGSAKYATFTEARCAEKLNPISDEVKKGATHLDKIQKLHEKLSADVLQEAVDKMVNAANQCLTEACDTYKRAVTVSVWEALSNAVVRWIQHYDPIAQKEDEAVTRLQDNADKCRNAYLDTQYQLENGGFIEIKHGTVVMPSAGERPRDYQFRFRQAEREEL